MPLIFFRNLPKKTDINTCMQEELFDRVVPLPNFTPEAFHANALADSAWNSRDASGAGGRALHYLRSHAWRSAGSSFGNFGGQGRTPAAG
jgi:hypothetical protein